MPPIGVVTVELGFEIDVILLEELLADLFEKGEKKPGPRRRGLIGGTGGAFGPFVSIPLVSELVGGKSTVSIDDVPVTKVGADISVLFTDPLRPVCSASGDSARLL